MTLPRIGITLGDPGGIGPEIVVKSLQEISSLPPAEYIIFGDPAVLEAEEKFLGISLACRPYRENQPAQDTQISLKEVRALRGPVAKGRACGKNGRASFRFFEEAVKRARRGSLQSVVTAPISKLSWNLAEIPWRGHTEYLEQFYPQAIMTFWAERLTVALFSHHVPLREALKRIRRKNLLKFFHILDQSAEKARPGRYELLVAGLNPHAGEGGLLGDEERQEIIPAIEAARTEGIPASGPYPPDVIFRKALGHPERIVVALYHDQGLIAFKMEAFETGVNVTLGMPFIRSSPDHGTAFDIAGKGEASFRSMTEAIRLAAELSPCSL